MQTFRPPVMPIRIASDYRRLRSNAILLPNSKSRRLRAFVWVHLWFLHNVLDCKWSPTLKFDRIWFHLWYASHSYSSRPNTIGIDHQTVFEHSHFPCSEQYLEWWCAARRRHSVLKKINLLLVRKLDSNDRSHCTHIVLEMYGRWTIFECQNSKQTGSASQVEYSFIGESINDGASTVIECG